MHQQNGQLEKPKTERPDNIWNLVVLFLIICAVIIFRYLVTGRWIHPQ